MTDTNRPPAARAAAITLVVIAAVSGFILLELLALVIGAVSGAGYWFMLIPVVLFALFGVALGTRK